MITGIVYDADSRTVPGAQVYFSDSAGKITSSAIGTVTDNAGAYKLSNTGDKYITASMMGLVTQTKPVNVSGNSVVDFILYDNSITLSGVEITAKPINKNLKYWIAGAIIVLIIAAWLIAKRRRYAPQF